MTGTNGSNGSSGHGANGAHAADRGDIELSVVVPVYCCAGCLKELHRRVVLAAPCPKEQLELILVEDGGPDNSWEVIEALVQADPSVRGVKLSRNFGQQSAITAGLAESRGRWVVVMDCDLQDPPELLGQFYAKGLEGHDVVLGRRRKVGQSPLRRWAAALYFRMMSAVSGYKIDGAHGSFSMLSRKVVDAFLRFEDRERHYLFIVRWMGFSRAEVEYDLAPRLEGKSAYTLAKLIRTALSGFFFQTTALLRWIIYLGLFVAACGALFAMYVLYRYFTGTILPGWTSIIVVMLILGGLTIAILGVLGLFISRIFDQVKGRPLYLISEARQRERAVVREPVTTRTEVSQPR